MTYQLTFWGERAEKDPRAIAELPPARKIDPYFRFVLSQAAREYFANKKNKYLWVSCLYGEKKIMEFTPLTELNFVIIGDILAHFTKCRFYTTTGILMGEVTDA